MAARDQSQLDITADVLLKAYACGIFPMAESADDPQLYWIEPQQRGVLPLDAVKVPRRLTRTIRQDLFEIRVDSDFPGVIEGCAGSKPGRRSTWINPRIRQLYGELFRRRHCHTVEVWQDGRLAGGLYGVSLGGVFFGESMFSSVRDASKIALVHLCARLIFGGYRLLDTQFVTDHLRQFGTIEIERGDFHKLLAPALEAEGQFDRLPAGTSGREALAIISSANAGPS
jgi:leucyl/phenylalanyl-tRNA--protein transferase